MTIHKRIFIPALLLTSLMGCHRADQSTETPQAGTEVAADSTKTDKASDLVELTEAQYQTAAIKLGPVESRTLSNLIRVNGVLNAPPQQQVSVATPYGGILTTSSLLPGTVVRKGQVLAVLENPEFIRLQQEYLETVSQLTFQQQEYERQRELSRENVGALKTYQQATAQLGTLRARAEGLRQQLALLGIPMARLQAGTISRTVSVHAPISGIVTAANVNRGRYVSANDVLFEIVNTSGLLAELTVFEGDVAKVQVGQRVRVSVVGENAERLGRIKLISRETGTDRTIKVYASLDGASLIQFRPGQSRPGTFLKASIETTATAEPALPEAALVQAGNQMQIFVFEGKQVQEGLTRYLFRSVAVRAGITENGYRAVTLPPDLKAGANIVLAGAYDLLSVMNNVEEE
ncbi:efflux RND transporter periplasmic adaptor subunit [Spirosoma utsteinense]|uniref:efflux RND transporter periplasmic adaptor subunit n=1 Tax=Spirosoma utsteinense TaxID=2585773 RepID=UPI0016491AAA|nr:efflux RND transporter periplasmic adaptor subunit [Spirosoma utsteinense]MBC3787762.1 cobalt-zinc-cadmium efflux system membrane fusion protein [Spirosoma utsteinense]